MTSLSSATRIRRAFAQRRHRHAHDRRRARYSWLRVPPPLPRRRRHNRVQQLRLMHRLGDHARHPRLPPTFRAIFSPSMGDQPHVHRLSQLLTPPYRSRDLQQSKWLGSAAASLAPIPPAPAAPAPTAAPSAPHRFRIRYDAWAAIQGRQAARTTPALGLPLHRLPAHSSREAPTDRNPAPPAACRIAL